MQLEYYKSEMFLLAAVPSARSAALSDISHFPPFSTSSCLAPQVDGLEDIHFLKLLFDWCGDVIPGRHCTWGTRMATAWNDAHSYIVERKYPTFLSHHLSLRYNIVLWHAIGKTLIYPPHHPQPLLPLSPFPPSPQTS